MARYSEIHARSLSDPSAFWRDQAAAIDWFEAPRTILSKDELGADRWFADGVLNTSHLALDSHVAAGRGQQAALIYESPVTGVCRSYTFSEVLEEVSRLAGALRNLGLTKGDRAILYMPMIPQAAFAMLACARLGVVHSVVFGGFAAHELTLRINDARPKVILTANFGIEVDRKIAYKPIVDEAIADSEAPPDHVIVFDRGPDVPFTREARDLDSQSIVNQAEPAKAVPVQGTDPLYILYTSGTTGTPKGIVRDNGGHAVALKMSMTDIYGVEPGDVFWAASDVGWVVGHSYIVYAPLIHGCTTVLFEGKPVRTPDAATFWRIIDKHRVKVMFTAPTAFRAIRKEDAEGRGMQPFDLSCLKRVYLAGERCDASTLGWLQEKLQIPVIDHWWQTESGWPMLANPAGVELLPIKPGSAGKPVAGFDIQILDGDGADCPAGEEGYVVARLPLPPGCLPTLYGNHARFQAGYLERFPGYYFTGDGGLRDEDGYVFITGRVDDVINVAGHRLSTAEMEEVVASHPEVAECAVFGIQDELKGQVPIAILVRKEGQGAAENELIEAVRQSIRHQIGAIASLKAVYIAARLPKTRSGKILRKTMRAIADGVEFKVPSTIDDPGILEEIRVLLHGS
ncbi:MAG: AMP-binding protein [Planctomycetota bacterium]